MQFRFQHKLQHAGRRLVVEQCPRRVQRVQFRELVQLVRYRQHLAVRHQPRSQGDRHPD
jgi:hypothetical protein